jgi:hypothetical protein
VQNKARRGWENSLPQSKKITCNLSTEQDHKRVRRWSCTKAIRSLTSWMQNKATRGWENSPPQRQPDCLLSAEQATRGSENSLTPKQQDHWQAECRTRTPEGGKMDLHQSNEITYLLSAKQGHKRVRKWPSTKAMRSLTCWVQNKATRGWEQSLPPKPQDHLPSECKMWPQESEKTDFQQGNKTTYFLSTEQGPKRVKNQSFTEATRSLTL